MPHNLIKEKLTELIKQTFIYTDLFLFCYERDFMLSLSDNNQTDIIEAFSSTFRYLDDLLNIDNPYFEKNGRSDITH